MVERRFRRRQLLLLAIPVVVLAFVVSFRALDPKNPCPAPSAAPQSELALMPAGLSLEGIGTVTDVRKDERYFRVKAFTTKPLDHVGVLIQEAVIAAGYRPAGIDTEGTETQVFFLRGSFAGGQATVRWAGCDGRSDIDLVLLDRNAVPSR